MEYKIRLIPTEKKKIYVDPVETMGVYLYPSEIKKLKIEEGSFLNDEMLDAIRKQITIPRAKKRALGILVKRDKTEAELLEKLAESENDPVSVEEAMEFVRKCDYVNDETYARDYINSRKKRKSFRMIRMDLIRKGISEEVLNTVFEEMEQDPEDLREQVGKYIRKFPELDEKNRQKVMAHFFRKGYQAELIRQLIEECEESVTD